MFDKRFARLLLYFLGWTTFVNIALFINLSSKLQHEHILHAIPFIRYAEYIALSAVWINVLTFPFAGLLSASLAFVSELIKNKHDYCNRTILTFDRFIRPSIVLGAFLFIGCLFLTVFVIHNSNHRICDLTWYFRTGDMIQVDYRSDREMSIGQLLQEIKKNSLEKEKYASGKVDKFKRIYNKSELMVEIYKKFSLPLLCFFCPILGCMLAIVISKLNLGKRPFFYLISLYIIYVIIGFSLWAFLIFGEELGDKGNLPPIAATFMAPGFIVALILVFFKPSYNIITTAHKYAQEQSAA